MDLQFGTLEEYLEGKPGIYRNIPERTYHSAPIKRASKSRIVKAYTANPRRVVIDYENRDEPKTEDTLLGGAAHAFILEKDVFDNNYVVFYGEKRSNAKKAEYQQLVDKYGGNYVIREKHLAQCEAMRDAVHSHDKAHKILTEPGEKELTILWIHEPTGLLCQCRIDVYPFSSQLIVDVKTTVDASEEAFSRTIGNFRYDCQAGKYMKAAKAVGLPVRGVLFIAVEKKDPHDVYTWLLKGEAIEDGWNELKPMFRLYRDCVESGEWPGPPEEIREIDVQGYRTRQIYYPYNDREAFTRP